MKPNLKVALAQIKIISGDLEGNSKQIVDGINRAINAGVDLVVFPELAITGYNCGMLFNQMHFIERNLDFLSKIIAPSVPNNLIVVLGFVDLIGKRFDGRPDIQNSAVVIQGGRIIGKTAKILLADGGHHDDLHYFTPGDKANVVQCVTHDGFQLKLGLAICEDTWSEDHSRDIVRELKQNGAELLIVLNQSYFYYGKQEKRKRMYQKHAASTGLPIIAVNNIGVGDIAKDFMIYDGGSMVYSSSGDLVTECVRFEPEFKTTTLHNTFMRSKPIKKYEEIYKALVFAQKHIFSDLGFSKALVCVSGGLDSSVALPIVVEAMGKENVYALSMPSKYNGDVTKGNAQKLCDALGVKLFWEPIDKIQAEFISGFKNATKEEPKPINISTFDAVGRTVAGIAMSQHLKAGLVSTSNHTEIVLNWFSWHDISTAAVYGPLSDLTKVEVYEMAQYINEKCGKEIIPYNLYNGETSPGPELADAAQASWDYFVVSGICAMLIRDRKDVQEIVEYFKTQKLPADYFPNNHDKKNVYSLVQSSDEFEQIVRMCFERQKASVFKAAQSAPPVIVSPFSRGFSNRETIINKYAGSYEFVPITFKSVPDKHVLK